MVDEARLCTAKTPLLWSSEPDATGGIAVRVLTVSFILLLIGLLPVSHVAAQDTAWTVEYYNNLYLLGDPAVSTQANAVNFNWGGGAPTAQIAPDNFSARFATDVVLPAGTYRFYALADDNIRITVDFNNVVIDTFDDPNVGQVISRDVTLPAGNQHIQVDYREVTGSAYVYVEWANLNTNPTGPSFGPPTQNPFDPNAWTAQYFANQNLEGAPVAVFSEASPTHNWGYNAPLANVPADNFSVRWTTTLNLTGGIYELNVLTDDGVRVYINGVPIIDEWHLATGQRYVQTINLPTGATGIQIDFFENTGVAGLDFNLRPQAAPVVITTDPIVTITAQVLNVRDYPGVSLGSILLRVNRGATYPIIGRNSDSSWWLIDVNGTTGWVSSPFVTELNTGSVPVIDPTNTPRNELPVTGGTGYLVTATPHTVNLRSGPGLGYSIIERFRAGTTAEIIGRNPSSSWWHINYNGVLGWVSARYAVIEAGVDVNTIPVTF